MLVRRSRSIQRDPLDGLVQVDDDAVDIDRRTRDLGLPDGLWWSVATLAGVAGGMTAMAWTLPLGEELGMAAGISVLAGVAYAAARRWGHRRFRWRVALVDGVKAAVATPCMFLVGKLLEDSIRAWW